MAGASAAPKDVQIEKCKSMKTGEMKGEKSKTQKEGEGPLGCSKALQDEQTTPEYFRYSMVILATCVAGTEVLGRYPALRTMTELWITKTCF